MLVSESVIAIATTSASTCVTYSEIVKDNPTITEEQFEIFKAACDAEAAKEKSKYMKGLQQRNMGCHHLRSRGYGGKMSIWAKEDAERESLGIPDPLAEFTVPQERDVLRARYHWDPVKKVFKTDPVMTEFMRLLVILVSDQFDCMFSHICKRSLFLFQRE